MNKNHFLFYILSFYSIGSHSQSFAQKYAERDFKMLDDSMVVHVGLQFGSDNIGVYIYDFPQDLLDRGLIIEDLSRPSYGSARIIGSQFSVTMSETYQLGDTFAIYLAQTEFAYSPVVFTLDDKFVKVNLGEDCYVLSCIPQNDPWMPTDYSPFILRKNEYYINPSNGKIKKAIKFINSGRYTSCDLEDLKYISTMGFYYDKKGIKHSGIDLIAAKKIELADWDLKKFDACFFR